MQRFFMEVSYDGSLYHGWQVQKNAVSVQQRINEALAKILRTTVETIGAGRTDTGVHAKQLYVHFDIKAGLIPDEDRFLHAINSLLPSDIAALRLVEVHQDAHARFDAVERSYAYHIHFRKDPFLIRRSWQLRDYPDVARMNEAAHYLLGTQDFGCFSKSNTQVFTNICTVKRAEWVENEEGLVFHITADRFLRNMVRAIVGTLLDIGQKRKEPLSMVAVIQSKDRAQAGTSVPAHGLYLTRVVYPYMQ
ncbi:tRNA pseudouridine(38-40) synthase TruA [Sphingobacterium griseoflavum]|uniref:tRNA pseudouridine synthase A n=1 Tax=Sphingobacterium griseoflavum TaxID=1474952 RepID=A0ABQ3HWV1_9SPHI|nr:tRNA pseudouridine(38-40) synthase TruA [Sphingobacterium griseoflavum]GHE28292.1 tRNA pseudouridine synthase A [Sphingobacterium griseoflavum]